MKLTANQVNTIITALRVAAATYPEDMACCNRSGDERVAVQFEKQMHEARQLSVALEDAEEVIAA